MIDLHHGVPVNGYTGHQPREQAASYQPNPDSHQLWPRPSRPVRVYGVLSLAASSESHPKQVKTCKGAFRAHTAGWPIISAMSRRACRRREPWKPGITNSRSAKQ